MHSYLYLAAFILMANNWAQAQSYPEVAADNRVTFRTTAAGANHVAVRGQWSKDAVSMQNAEGTDQWTVTTEALPSGVWEYNFAVDKLNVIDSQNPAIKPQRQPSRSILHIVSNPPAPWDFQDVPHGTVHHHDYFSKSLQRKRQLSVYTPPGYERDNDKQYPLLVLQHGSGDNHLTWVAHGKANWILDRLIADKQATPMIVLMIDGHPLGQVPRENASKREESLIAFETELLTEAIPIAESNYRIESDRTRRAIAGLSMGGWQSVNVGLAHRDQFGSIGSFSGAAILDRVQPFIAAGGKVNQQLDLFWIACGKDDFLLSQNETLISGLKEHGIEHQWELTDGDHSWPVWRNYLVQFLPKLFAAR